MELVTELINDDCIEAMKSLPDKSIDMVLTSPPYDNLRNYNNSLKWDFSIFKDVAKELQRTLKVGGVIIWVVGDSTIKGTESLSSFKQAIFFNQIKLNLHDTMIYRKLSYMPLTHRRYEQEFEYMFCFSKGRPNTFNPIKVPCKYAGTKTRGNPSMYKSSDDKRTSIKKYSIKDSKIKGNIFEYYTGSHNKNYGHPAPFPECLATDQVVTWSNPGDIVMDPFMGSGTTGVACKNLNRDFIGIELDKNYFEIARKRIDNVSNGE